MYIPIHRRISPACARKILALEIPGVFSQREYRLFYPQGEAMAHILGFTNFDDQSQEGIGLAFDERLLGMPGAEKVIPDCPGRIVLNVDMVRAAAPGMHLSLSTMRKGVLQERNLLECIYVRGRRPIKS